MPATSYVQKLHRRAANTAVVGNADDPTTLEHAFLLETLLPFGTDGTTYSISNYLHDHSTRGNAAPAQHMLATRVSRVLYSSSLSRELVSGTNLERSHLGHGNSLLRALTTNKFIILFRISRNYADCATGVYRIMCSNSLVNPFFSR